jgi:hypothetical protein
MTWGAAACQHQSAGQQQGNQAQNQKFAFLHKKPPSLLPCLMRGNVSSFPHSTNVYKKPVSLQKRKPSDLQKMERKTEIMPSLDLLHNNFPFCGVRIPPFGGNLKSIAVTHNKSLSTAA